MIVTKCPYYTTNLHSSSTFSPSSTSIVCCAGAAADAEPGLDAARARPEMKEREAKFTTLSLGINLDNADKGERGSINPKILRMSLMEAPKFVLF